MKNIRHKNDSKTNDGRRRVRVHHRLYDNGKFDGECNSLTCYKPHRYILETTFEKRNEKHEKQRRKMASYKRDHKKVSYHIDSKSDNECKDTECPRPHKIVLYRSLAKRKHRRLKEEKKTKQKKRTYSEYTAFEQEGGFNNTGHFSKRRKLNSRSIRCTNNNVSTTLFDNNTPKQTQILHNGNTTALFNVSNTVTTNNYLQLNNNNVTTNNLYKNISKIPVRTVQRHTIPTPYNCNTTTLSNALNTANTNNNPRSSNNNTTTINLNKNIPQIPVRTLPQQTQILHNGNTAEFYNVLNAVNTNNHLQLNNNNVTTTNLYKNIPKIPVRTLQRHTIPTPYNSNITALFNVLHVLNTDSSNNIYRNFWYIFI